MLYDTRRSEVVQYANSNLDNLGISVDFLCLSALFSASWNSLRNLPPGVGRLYRC